MPWPCKALLCPIAGKRPAADTEPAWKWERAYLHCVLLFVLLLCEDVLLLDLLLLLLEVLLVLFEDLLLVFF